MQPRTQPPDRANRYDGADVEILIGGRAHGVDGARLAVTAADGTRFEFDAGVLVRDELAHFDDERADGVPAPLEAGAMFGAARGAAAAAEAGDAPTWMRNWRALVGTGTGPFGDGAGFRAATEYRVLLRDRERRLNEALAGVKRRTGHPLAVEAGAVRAERLALDERFRATDEHRRTHGRQPWQTGPERDDDGLPDMDPCAPLGMGEWDTEEEPGDREQALRWFSQALIPLKAWARRVPKDAAERARRIREIRRATHVKDRLRAWLDAHPPTDDPRAHVERRLLREIRERHGWIIDEAVERILADDPGGDPRMARHVAGRVFNETMRLVAGVHPAALEALAPDGSTLADAPT